MDKVLVTGGAGFLGSFLVERLVEKGLTVKVFDNLWRGNMKNLEAVRSKVEILNGDIRDYSQLNNAMQGIDTVFHLASVQGTKFFYDKPELVLEVGIIGNLNVAKSVVENNVRRIFFTSSSEVYSEPKIFPTPETHPLIVPDATNPRWSYSTTKIAGEIIFNTFASKYGFDVTIFRIHNAYGPRMGWQHVIPEFCRRLLLSEKFTIQGTGEQRRSFCFVSDIIDGMILASERDDAKNETFNLGNDFCEIKIIDLATKLIKISGLSVKPLLVEAPMGSTPRRIPDISKARKLLGYNPKVYLDEGLEKTFYWYKREIEWWKNNAKQEEYPWETHN